MENPIKMDDLGVPLFLEIAISMNKPLINRCSGTRPPKTNRLFAPVRTPGVASKRETNHLNQSQCLRCELS